MDLLKTVQKSGSRGGVNFSWDEVAGSSHRENYLGHSVMAPVGRWQKGKDLNWYAKTQSGPAVPGETDEERQERERKEELRKIKEAEEDLMAQTLGLPIPQRNTTGANAIDVGNQRTMGQASGPADDEENPRRQDVRRERSRRHGDPERRERKRHRSTSRGRNRDGERRSRRHDVDNRNDRARDRSGSRGRHRGDRHRRRHRSRSRSGEPRERRDRRSDRERTDRRGDTEYRDHIHRSRSPREHRRGSRENKE